VLQLQLQWQQMQNAKPFPQTETDIQTNNRRSITPRMWMTPGEHENPGRAVIKFNLMYRQVLQA